MTDIDKVKYWIELSEYDYETAEAMLSSKRYLYVGFMCHQTIEKILKAYFTNQIAEVPPFTHSLSYLAKKCGLIDKLSEDQLNFLDILEPLNIEARYPSHKKRLMKSLNEARCLDILKKTKQLQEWIKQKL